MFVSGERRLFVEVCCRWWCQVVLVVGVCWQSDGICSRHYVIG